MSEVPLYLCSLGSGRGVPKGVSLYTRGFTNLANFVVWGSEVVGLRVEGS